jgi:hypothetical protein
MIGSHDSRRNIYYPGTFHACGDCTEAQSETVLMKSSGSHVYFSVFSLDRFESICRFLHFIDKTSKDIFEGPQNMFYR